MRLSSTIAIEADAPARAAAVDELSRMPEVADAAATRAVSVSSDSAMVGNLTNPATQSGQVIDDIVRGGGLVKSAVIASGSGGANQAAQINAELDSLATFGGGVLTVRRGIHDNLSTITVPPYCTLRGVGWSGTDQGKGSVLRFAPGQNGIILSGPSSRIEGLSIISRDGGTPGTSVGVTIEGAHCTARDVNVALFGSHGWMIDSESGGNKNLFRLDNIRAWGNGGCGLFVRGLDSNAGTVTHANFTANKGQAQLFSEGCANHFKGIHINSASVGGSTVAVWDNNISNTYEVYIEKGSDPGSNFHLGSKSTYGKLTALFYAPPVNIVADQPASSLLTWDIYDKFGYRRLELLDTYLGSEGAGWQMESGVAGANRFRFRKRGGPSVYEIDGDLRWLLLRIPLRNATYTTEARPSATQSGAGSQIYDSTLGKPLWSNGTIWRDANGNPA